MLMLSNIILLKSTLSFILYNSIQNLLCCYQAETSSINESLPPDKLAKLQGQAEKKSLEKIKVRYIHELEVNLGFCKNRLDLNFYWFAIVFDQPPAVSIATSAKSIFFYYRTVQCISQVSLYCSFYCIWRWYVTRKLVVRLSCTFPSKETRVFDVACLGVWRSIFAPPSLGDV